MGLGIKIDRTAALQSLAKPAVVGAATVLFGPVGGAASLAAASVVDSPVGKVITDAVGSAVKVTERDKGLQEHLAEAVEESLGYAFDSVEGETGRPISDELRSQVISSATSGSGVAVSDDGRAYLHAVMRQACIACHDGALMDDDLRGRVVEAYVGRLSEKMLEENGVLYRTIMVGAIRSMRQEIANVSVGMGTLQENDARILEQLQQLSDVFSHGDGNAKMEAYYDYVCKQFRDDNGSELYGEVPLRECYLEPTIRDERGELRSVSEYIESWVGGDNYIAVICGEPGHGKTSLCRKAVYDFRTSGWLAGKVPNVLYFSLNPARTAALADGELDLYALLSWGDNRRNPKRRIDEEDCRGALVFLDGFDELLEWRPGFDLWSFVQDHVAGFQLDTGTHVIITSRTMAAGTEPSAHAVFDGTGRVLSVPVLRMQPVSREHQLAWIEGCIGHFRRLAADDSGAVGTGERNKASRATTELEEYLPRYRRLHEDGTLQAILGVPIILRMVVAARYVPKGGESIVQIYDNLFSITWHRHRHREGDQSMEGAKAQLSRHALRVYLDEEDTAAVEDVLRSPWSFSFYSTHGERSRVGFLHRSFYQYFLAHEVVGWLRRYSEDGDANALRASLACLARRQLDGTTLGYVRDIHDADSARDDMGAAFDKAYEVLRETDGFLPIPDLGGIDVGHIKALAPSERARNVFWNVVSACSACGASLASNKLVSDYPLRHYDMSGCNLAKARLSSANLGRADLRGADLRGADLVGAYLRGADLVEADLRGADLVEANLVGAYLRGADLVGADLRGAYIVGADLGRADLRLADLRRASLVGAHLRGADLVRADLRKANIRWADLMGARLNGAVLAGARLDWKDLAEVDLTGVDLEDAIIEGTRPE